MAAKIITEIDSYNSRLHFKVGLFFITILVIIFFILKNINNNETIPFVATFNYVEGISNNSEVQIAGIKIGNVSKITISSNGVIIKGFIDKDYNIPDD